jgi:type III secretion system (T3SS) SseB-like protein
MPGARQIPDPGFSGDDGRSDPALRAALASLDADPGGHLEVLVALQTSRLLVPVVAVLGDVETDETGLTHDKSSDMATALLTGRDGRQALLAFTGLDTLAAWRPDARPVPVAAPMAARAAIQEGASALVVDVAGPTTYAVEGELLEGLARGWTLVRVEGGYGWRQE